MYYITQSPDPVRNITTVYYVFKTLGDGGVFDTEKR